MLPLQAATPLPLGPYSPLWPTGTRSSFTAVIIAGAGGAAHLAGVLAAVTTLPVLGVPIPSRALRGLDSLLSIVQMPGGVPVGTLGIGKSGATNAALLAVAILGLEDAALAARYRAYRENQTRRVQQEPPLELTAEALCLSMKRR